jgi:hypothetical protein
MAALGAIRPELLVRPVGWRCPDSAVCGSAGQRLERGKPYRVTSGESVYVAADHRATNPPRSPYLRK